MEHLRLTQYLVFGYVNLFETIGIDGFAFLFVDQETPFIIVLIDEVLHFELNARLQILVLTQLYHILQYFFYEFECYLFGGMFG